MSVIAQRPRLVAWGLGLGLCAAHVFDPAAMAQQVRNKYGSPLDTLRNTHLTTDAPPAKDFVRETSPDKSTLDYTPLTGADPERPKLRSASEVQALQAELESAGARNERQAKGLRPSRANGPGSRTTKASAGRAKVSAHSAKAAAGSSVQPR